LLPKINIAKTTRNVDNEVQIDLLIVCRTLSSIIAPNFIDQASSAFSSALAFSLILSKTIIVSLILYHIIVNNASIKIVSTCNVGSIIINKPYAHAVTLISKNIVHIVTVARICGGIIFLILPKDKNI